MAEVEKQPNCTAAESGAKRHARNRLRVWSVVGLIGFCAVVFWLGRRMAAPPAKTGKVRMACELRVRDILTAIQTYTMEHDHFPPAYIADKDGRPMHSWRVVIWPYLEKNKAFRQYRWDEPWNSENNLKLADQMPRALRCPHDFDAKPCETSYLMLAGPGTWFEEGASPRAGQLPNPEKTMLLIEAAGEKIHWMEPRDLDISQLAAWESIRSFHRTGKTCGFADGSVEVLKDEATVGDIRPFVRKSEWPHRPPATLPVTAP